MVEHADAMQFAGQRGERETRGRRHLQREAQAELPGAADHQRGADAHRQGRDDVEDRERLPRRHEQQRPVRERRHEHVVGPWPGDPAAFRGVDACIELQQLPRRRQRREDASRVVERIMIGRDVNTVDERRRQAVHGQHEGHGAGRQPQRQAAMAERGGGRDGFHRGRAGMAVDSERERTGRHGKGNRPLTAP
ncbi:MAG: hypothetical protein IPM80_19685 [Proteobacteria bacterium]|nr:hypothetical protein [Pseudomonadota bacterium]